MWASSPDPPSIPSLVERNARRGTLAAFLTSDDTLPRERWHERVRGLPLLHWAATHGDVQAADVLLRANADPDAVDGWGMTAAHLAARAGHHEVVALLGRAGAALNVTDAVGHTPLAIALLSDSFPCAHALVLHGVRTATLRPKLIARAHSSLLAVERGRVRCRAVVVALLALKRRRHPWLASLDRFVLRELGVWVWATRGQSPWQT